MSKEITKKLDRILDILEPKQEPIPEIVTKTDILKIYGKSGSWFVALKVKHKKDFQLVQFKKQGCKTIFYHSEDLITLLKSLGYEPK